MNDKLQRVTFEQSRKLKKIGFDWPCRESYDNNGVLTEDPLEWNYNDAEGLYSAPTVALVLKWFRDVQNVTYEAAESALLDALIKQLEEEALK